MAIYKTGDVQHGSVVLPQEALKKQLPATPPKADEGQEQENVQQQRRSGSEHDQ